MKHGYVILDNDVPLGVATSDAAAERAILRERKRVEETIRKAAGTDPGASYEATVRNRIAEHDIRWVRVPYV